MNRYCKSLDSSYHEIPRSLYMIVLPIIASWCFRCDLKELMVGVKSNLLVLFLVILCLVLLLFEFL